jgi:hypothetical protein
MQDLFSKSFSKYVVDGAGMVLYAISTMKLESNKRKAVASLIIFADDVQRERVERWIAALQAQGHVVGSVTREYDPGYGEPVWYIP